jgi:hypothetical protein
LAVEMECAVSLSQDSWLPATDYPRASRSFPRIADSGNEIVRKWYTGRKKLELLRNITVKPDVLLANCNQNTQVATVIFSNSYHFRVESRQ